MTFVFNLHVAAALPLGKQSMATRLDGPHIRSGRLEKREISGNGLFRYPESEIS